MLEHFLSGWCWNDVCFFEDVPVDVSLKDRLEPGRGGNNT